MTAYIGYLTAAALVIIYAGSMRWLKISRIRLEFDNLDEGMRFRILHISDLHGNSFNRSSINIFNKIRSLDYDFAVITGDLIQDYSEELNPHVKMLENLVKKTSVYYVDGNHEKYVYADIRKKLEGLGIIVLCNQSVEADIRGVRLKIIGVRDWYWQRKNKFNFESLFPVNGNKKEPEKSSFTLLLSHQPQIIKRVKNYAPDLILCGHTHGGQLRLPGLKAFYAPGQGFFPKYSDGLYYEDKSQMYISKGIGATNFRVRFYNRPEITLIEVLGKAVKVKG